MATTLAVIILHVHQINWNLFLVKLLFTNLDYDSGSDTRKPALQNFSQYGTIQ